VTTLRILTDGGLRGIGLDPLTVAEIDNIFSSTNVPYLPGPGESLYDNMPDRPVVDAINFSSSSDIYTVLQAVESSAAANGGVYVRLQKATEKVYTLNDFKSYGTNNWLGFANSSRRVMGFIGAGAPTTADESIIRIAPGAVNASAGARTFALNATANPTPIGALYFSGSGTTTPFFFSGIRFQGTLQTPFSTYSSASQTYFRRNQTVASPLPWRGMSLWRAQPGSIMQFCLFEGFAWAMNSAPPFEMGIIDTNYSNGLRIRRCEFDGRIAASIDSSRPRSSGGIMWNKDLDITVEDSWLHHTRRSGFAMNTNTNSTSERYAAINFQTDEIANVGDDGYASDVSTLPGQFGASNVEGLAGQFRYTDVRMSSVQLSKVNIAVPYSTENGVIVLPERPLIIARNVTTDDMLYGGIVRYGISKTPNSTGTSPAWTRVSTRGIAGSGLFDIRNADDEPMTGIRETAYNPAVHRPETHFIVYYTN